MGKIIPFVILFFIILAILGTCKGKDDEKGDGTYMLYCQKMIKTSVKYPTTVEFDNFKARVAKRSDGVTVVLPFTAKNAFGVPVANTANCSMNKDGTNQQIFIH